MTTWSTQPDPINGFTGIDYGTLVITATGSTTARSLADRAADVVNVLDFDGVTGDGVTDDTTAIAAAIAAAANKTLYFPAGTYLISSVTIAASTIWFGDGDASIIKMKASTSAYPIIIDGTSIDVQFRYLTFDGNNTNQTSENAYYTMRFLADGTSSDPASLTITDCTFKNGNIGDIQIFPNSARSSVEHVLIAHNRFLAGAEGQSVGHDPRYISIASPVNYVITENLFDFMGTPASYGRAGITSFDGHSAASTDKARGVVANNFFSRVGRSQAASTLGCIDLYNYGRGVSITGNTLVDCYGRGIDSKADCEALVITGNIIDGVSGLGGVDPNAAIAVNSSTNSNARGTVTIQGNAIYNSAYDGIVFTGSNSGITDYARAISIQGNVLKTITRRGISVVLVDDAIVAGNSIDGADTGIHAGSIQERLVVTGNCVSDTTANGINVDSTSTAAWINITGNHVQDTGGRGIMVDSAAAGLVVGNTIKNSTSAAIDTQDIGGAFLVANNVTDSSIPYSKSGTNSGLRVQHNMFSTAMAGSTRELTIATGAITAFADWHTVDTESDAATDDLDTVNGGFDGAIVTLRAINGARDVVVKDGTGNMKLSGDCTLNNVEDTITMRYMSGTWYELSRSDNGA